MMKKGSFGYINNKRKWMITLFVILLAADLIMFFVSKAYFETTKNIFSIFTVLVCLPVAMIGVQAVLSLRASGCSASLRDKLVASAGDQGIYDLYLTSYSKNFQLSHAFVSGGSLIAVTESPSCDVKAGEEHIKSMLSSNGIKGLTVKIFTDSKKYCERVKTLAEASNGKLSQSEEAAYELLKALSI